MHVSVSVCVKQLSECALLHPSEEAMINLQLHQCPNISLNLCVGARARVCVCLCACGRENEHVSFSSKIIVICVYKSSVCVYFV